MTSEANLLRVVGLVVAKLSLLLENLVQLGGVRRGAVATAGGGSGYGQNGGEHELEWKRTAVFISVISLLVSSFICVAFRGATTKF